MKIRKKTSCNEYNKTYYYKEFEIEYELPEIELDTTKVQEIYNTLKNAENKGNLTQIKRPYTFDNAVLSVTEIELDCEENYFYQDEEYKFYEVKEFKFIDLWNDCIDEVPPLEEYITTKYIAVEVEKE